MGNVFLIEYKIIVKNFSIEVVNGTLRSLDQQNQLISSTRPVQEDRKLLLNNIESVTHFNLSTNSFLNIPLQEYSCCGILISARKYKLQTLTKDAYNYSKRTDDDHEC